MSWLNTVVFGPKPAPRTQHCAVLVNNRNLYVFGGHNLQNKYFDDLHMMDLGTLQLNRALGS